VAQGHKRRNVLLASDGGRLRSALAVLRLWDATQRPRVCLLRA